MDNLFHLAYKCLSESNLNEKLSLSTEISEIILEGHIEIKSSKEKVGLISPGRPEKPVLIAPEDLPKRNIGTTEGKAAMIHSFTHIEFNAINPCVGFDISFSGYARRILFRLDPCSS
ncbi:MAG: DUF455 family protein [Proteobacteria bacterium]|nr:DUF455 family protein [Pseudomonadota bacterium]